MTNIARYVWEGNEEGDDKYIVVPWSKSKSIFVNSPRAMGPPVVSIDDKAQETTVSLYRGEYRTKMVIPASRSCCERWIDVAVSWPSPTSSGTAISSVG